MTTKRSKIGNVWIELQRDENRDKNLKIEKKLSKMTNKLMVSLVNKQNERKNERNFYIENKQKEQKVVSKL